MAISRIFFVILFLIGSSAIAQSVQQWDIVINELLPDPSPPVGLPNSEFIELKNVSDTSFNLSGWQLSDGTNIAIININYILPKDSFVIICPSNSVNSFQLFGASIGVANFPSLNNDADIITLYSPAGNLVHVVGYSADWYQNGLKSEGGWSLEMIDPNNPCAAFSNWTASENPKGGTPGRENSVADNNPDEDLPALIRAFTIDSLSIVAIFDEPIDTNSLTTESFSLEGNKVKKVSPIGPLNKMISIELTEALPANEVKQLIITELSDCAGNRIGQLNKTRVGRPTKPAKTDIIINEILFNPAAGGYDYIELYNRSKKIIDLTQVLLANKSSTGLLTNHVQVRATGWLIFPGDYVVITENAKWLKQNYTVKNHEAVLETNQLVSLPDDKGSFALISLDGITIDEISYDQKWHFALINEREGVALERISANGSTQDETNWSSATDDIGYGTPGYQNSQQHSGSQIKGSITVSPKLFSPNYDGRDDYAFICYQLDQPGYVATVTIHDSYGRKIRTLVYNQRLSFEGQWRWDGLNDQSYPMGAGMYLVLTDLFDLRGKKRKFKTVVILAATSR